MDSSKDNFAVQLEWSLIASLHQAIIGSDDGSLPILYYAIIWTNAGILLIWSLGTNFNKTFIKI